MAWHSARMVSGLSAVAMTARSRSGPYPRSGPKTQLPPCTQLTRIVKRAGLEPWPRIFHNMRSSRQTEQAEKLPSHVVCKFMGNSLQVAQKHYLQVTDEHFEWATKSGAQVAQNAAQHAHVSPRTHSQETTKAPAATRAYANGCDTGLESATASSGEDRIRTCGPVARSRI